MNIELSAFDSNAHLFLDKTGKEDAVFRDGETVPAEIRKKLDTGLYQIRIRNLLLNARTGLQLTPGQTLRLKAGIQEATGKIVLSIVGENSSGNSTASADQLAALLAGQGIPMTERNQTIAMEMLAKGMSVSKELVMQISSVTDSAEEIRAAVDVIKSGLPLTEKTIVASAQLKSGLSPSEDIRELIRLLPALKKILQNSPEPAVSVNATDISSSRSELIAGIREAIDSNLAARDPAEFDISTILETGSRQWQETSTALTKADILISALAHFRKTGTFPSPAELQHMITNTEKTPQTASENSVPSPASSPATAVNTSTLFSEIDNLLNIAGENALNNTEKHAVQLISTAFPDISRDRGFIFLLSLLQRHIGNEPPPRHPSESTDPSAHRPLFERILSGHFTDRDASQLSRLLKENTGPRTVRVQQVLQAIENQTLASVKNLRQALDVCERAQNKMAILKSLNMDIRPGNEFLFATVPVKFNRETQDVNVHVFKKKRKKETVQDYRILMDLNLSKLGNVIADFHTRPGNASLTFYFESSDLAEFAEKSRIDLEKSLQENDITATVWFRKKEMDIREMVEEETALSRGIDIRG